MANNPGEFIEWLQICKNHEDPLCPLFTERDQENRLTFKNNLHTDNYGRSYVVPEPPKTWEERLVSAYDDSWSTGWLRKLAQSFFTKLDTISEGKAPFLKAVSNYFHLCRESIPRPISNCPNNTIIRAVAFHPYRNRLAVVRDDDAVFIYDVRDKRWLPLCLTHEFQERITCIEWQPVAGGRLALGCATGICIWHIMGDLTHPGKAWMRYFSFPGHTNVSSLSWCPRGDLLASSSPKSSDAIVWNVATGEATPLLASTGYGVMVVRWSHNSFYLFVGTLCSTMHVWETLTWTHESWDFPDYIETADNVEKRIPSGGCQCAAWSPDGKLLVIAEIGRSMLWTLALHHTPPRIDGTLLQSSLEISECYSGLSEDTEICVRELAWSCDVRGERLAVTIAAAGVGSANSHCVKRVEGDDSILLFSVVQVPQFLLKRCGELTSQSDTNRPYGLRFWPACRTGAILASIWLDGSIKIHSLQYKTKLHDSY
jgi:WD40 repeat protein